MTRVLVTGATGFLGRHVVRALQARGMTVTGLSRTGGVDGIETIHGDLAGDVSSLLGGRTWDAVVNLAGPITGGYEELVPGIGYAAEHVRIALNLRRYASTARIVNTSSMTVYGEHPAAVITESHPRAPEHLYGLGKMLAEDVLLSDPALDAWSLRLPGLFSASRKGGGLFHFCRAARAGEPIKVTAKTPTAWNILHAADAAEAIALAIVAPGRAGGAMNIAYDEAIELVDIAHRIAAIAGTGSRVENVTEVVHPPVTLDSSRAKAAIGWRPVPLQQRLTELYNDYANS